MTERIPATVAQSCNHARRGQAVRGEPSARLRERKGRGEDEPTNDSKPAGDRRRREWRVAREIFFNLCKVDRNLWERVMFPCRIRTVAEEARSAIAERKE